MIRDPKNKAALGKGLSSFLTEIDLDESQSDLKDGYCYVSISDIHTDNVQPRTRFDDSGLQELSRSIQEHGVLSPLIVRRREEDNTYDLIAGERRLRACRMLGFLSVPVIVKDVSGARAFEYMLVENIQREDLTPIEEAQGYQRLIEEHQYTHEKLSSTLGKSRSHISNMLRLLDLPEDVQRMVNEKKITMGHARALVTFDKPQFLAEKILQEGWSVRQTEAWVKAKKNGPTNRASSGSMQEPEKLSSCGDLLNIGQMLTETLGLKVEITQKTVTIHYTSLESLDALITKFN